jgi:hypothetical protein
VKYEAFTYPKTNHGFAASYCGAAL